MSTQAFVRAIAAASILLAVSLTGAIPPATAADSSSENARLLAPRSLPYGLQQNTGEVEVAFKVLLVGSIEQPPEEVTLASRQLPNSRYVLNDSGRDGDIRAGDRIYGGRITLDTNRIDAETCLEFGATAPLDGKLHESPLYRLCASRFPSGIAESNTDDDNRVEVPGASDAVANELLLRYVVGSSEGRLADLVDAIGGSVVGSIAPRRMLQIAFPQPLTLSQLKTRAEIMRSQAEIENAYLNFIGAFAYAPSDAEFGNQHGLQTINADDAWDANATGSGVTVTILDSGIAAHPDLPISSADTANHGTAIAGIVAAITNDAMGTGIAGIAHGSTLETFTVSATTAVTFSQMVAGFQAVASSGTGSIVNASFYHTLAPPVTDVLGIDDQFDLCAAINDVVLSGAIPIAVVVNAAGNDGTDGWHYPGRCNDATAAANAQLTNKELFITVAGSVSCAGLAGSCAEGTADTHYSGSNHGDWIDLHAPGTSVRSTDNGGGYSDFTGTSFAAPMVTAAAAILDGCGTALEQIETVLESNGGASIAMPAAGSRPRIDINAAVGAGNSAPSAIDTTGLTLVIDENTDTSGGLALGAVGTIDADSCDNPTYSVVGGADAASFSFTGASLIFDDGVLDFESQSSYSVTLRSTDAFGLSVDQAIVVSINDLPEPVDIVLVMDRSGSMNGPSAVTGSKLMALQSAASLFADQIAMDSVHRLGLVQFNTAVVPFVAPDIFPFGTVTPGNVGAANNAINSIGAGGGTNILDGLQQGVTDLDVPSPSPRSVAVLFTDGRHNSPSVLDDATLQSELETRINAVSSSMELYSIGFGSSTSSAPLSAAANANGGWHVDEVDSLSMAKNFSLVAAAVMDDVTLTDPVFTLKPGQQEKLEVAVSAADSDLTFIVHWDEFDPGRIQTRIVTADGSCELDLFGSGIKRAVGINYLVVRVELPHACASGPAHGGNWQVQVSASENNRTPERVDILAYASSAIRLDNRVQLGDGVIDIEAVLRGDGLGNVNFSAFLLPPLPQDKRSGDNDRLGSDPDSVGAIPKPENVPRSPIEIRLEVDQCDPHPVTCPDGAKRGSGSFRVDKNGLYQVRLVAEAVDASGLSIRREQLSSVYLTVADPFSQWYWWLLLLLLMLLLLFALYKISRD